MSKQLPISAVRFGDCLLSRDLPKTSFSAVAQRAGLQRSIVQYYFSKKEDFATIVNAQVSETIMAAVDELYPDVDKLSRYHPAIQIYFTRFSIQRDVNSI